MFYKLYDLCHTEKLFRACSLSKFKFSSTAPAKNIQYSSVSFGSHEASQTKCNLFLDWEKGLDFTRIAISSSLCCFIRTTSVSNRICGDFCYQNIINNTILLQSPVSCEEAQSLLGEDGWVGGVEGYSSPVVHCQRVHWATFWESRHS